MSNNLTVLHLSDLHFGQGEFWDHTIAQGLIESIPSAITSSQVSIPRIDLVVISGDITQSGSAPEFTDVAAALEGLRKTLKLERDQFLFVPGNHDVQREERKAERLLLRGATADAWRKVDECIKAGDPGAILSTPLACYTDFVRKFNPACASDSWTSKHELGDLTVRFLGMNSSLVAFGGSDDKSKLTFGAKSLDEIGRARSLSDLAILVCHHPIDWLATRDAEVVRQRLSSGELAGIVCGHIHDQSSTVEPSGKAFILQSGALHDRNGVPFTFSVLQLCREQDYVELRSWVFERRAAEARFFLDVRRSGGQPYVSLVIKRPRQGQLVRVEKRHVAVDNVDSLRDRNLKFSGFLTAAFMSRLLTFAQACHVWREVRWARARGSKKNSGAMAVELGFMSEFSKNRLFQQPMIWAPLKSAGAEGDELRKRNGVRSLRPNSVQVVAAMSILLVGGLGYWLALRGSAPGDAWGVAGWSAVITGFSWLALLGVEAPPVLSGSFKPLLGCYWAASIGILMFAPLPHSTMAGVSLAAVGTATLLSSFWRQYKLMKGGKRDQQLRSLLSTCASEGFTGSDTELRDVMQSLMRLADQNPWPRIASRINPLRWGRDRYLRAINVIYLVPEVDRDGVVIGLKPRLWECIHGGLRISSGLDLLRQRLRKCLFDFDWFREKVEKPRLDPAACRALPDHDEHISLVGAAYSHRRAFVMADRKECYAFSDKFLHCLAGDGDDDGELAASVNFHSGIVIPVPPNRSECVDQHGVLAVYRNLPNSITREDIYAVVAAARALGMALDRKRVSHSMESKNGVA